MAKLTLSVDEQVIHRAKDYAKHHGISISEMVETYLNTVTSPIPRSSKPTPVLDSLRGILKGANVDDYHGYLEQKYR